MINCKDCKHWDAETEYPPEDGAANCDMMITMVEARMEINNEGGGIEDEYDVLFFYTSSNFGCVMGEKRSLR